MKQKIIALIKKYPNVYLFIQLFRPHLKAVKGNLQSVHDDFALDNNSDRCAVDLGCGTTPSNRFNVNNIYGLDLHENKSTGVYKCRLGFEKIPFEDNSIDYLTAYDLLEHIPRYSDHSDIGHTPFIYLMNECFRVLRPGGVFLSQTPIYPYLGAFQDPTHNNIMTVDTFRMYFSNEKHNLADHYGVTANFKIKYQGMLGQHMVAVLVK